MKISAQDIMQINSVKELHTHMDLPGPANPLITIIDHALAQEYFCKGSSKIYVWPV